MDDGTPSGVSVRITVRPDGSVSPTSSTDEGTHSGVRVWRKVPESDARSVRILFVGVLPTTVETLLRSTRGSPHLRRSSTPHDGYLVLVSVDVKHHERRSPHFGASENVPERANLGI